MAPRFLGSRIAELPADERHAVEVNYRRAKILIALGVAIAVVPFWLLIALTPDPGVPSQSHILPFELVLTCVGVAAFSFAAGILFVSRVRREVDRPRTSERRPN
jgi:hypothetical protein